MRQDTRCLRVGVIGCGHWGPNHIRVFSGLERSDVVACADVNQLRLDRIKRRYPSVRATADYRELLRDSAIDAVVIATPTCTHAMLTREALEAGKHVLVEKPLCMTGAEARELSALAGRVGRVLMVGHVFLFNNGIVKLRELIANGELGRIHYIDAARTNLGPVRGDVNALYDLGTHDISIFNHLLAEQPSEVSAHGSCISQPSIEDVCFATLKYASGAIGHLHVSWLNPRKVRTITVVGDRKMAHWDDIDPSHCLRIYDKGLDEPPNYDSFGEFQYLLRNADVHLPRVEQVEPLVNQAEAFLDSVLEGAACRSGGPEAQAVVEALEAASNSLANGSRFWKLSAPAPTDPVSVDRESVTPANAVVGPGSHWRTQSGGVTGTPASSNRPALPSRQP